MELIKYFKMGFQKYADFSTRSSRSEFWWFQLGYLLMFVPVLIILGLATFLFVDGVGDDASDSLMGLIILAVVLGIIIMGTIIPQIAIFVRRLHDVGHSGWLYLLTMIPYVGTIAWVVFGVLESQPKANKWGPVSGAEAQDSLRESFVDFDEDSLV